VAAILIDAVQQRALPLRQRSRARGLLRPEPVISRHLGLHRDLPLLDALVAAFRAADAEDDGIAPGLGIAEHAAWRRPDRRTPPR
jgi:hypothetical protein